MSDAGDVMQGLEDRPWGAPPTPHRLAGKPALVTGAGTRGGIPIGIGEAIAIVFATQGAKVAVVDISPERAQHTVDIIGQLGGDAVALTADVTDEAQVARAVGAAVDAIGGLDTLVNNAAISGGGRSPENVALDEWDAVLRLNLDAAMLCARHAIPHLKAAGGGAIVNLTSVAAARHGQRRVRSVEGGTARRVARLGVRERAPQHPGQLPGARSRLHSDGAGRRRTHPRDAPPGRHARRRGVGLGHRVAGGVPRVGGEPGDHRDRAHGRLRHHGDAAARVQPPRAAPRSSPR